MLTSETKSEIRWELAEINNKLNRLLKQAVASGPRQSTDNNIHALRTRRDVLLGKLQNV